MKVAKNYFERNLALAQEANNKRWTAIALNNLGNVAHHATANFSAAQQYNAQSLELYREVGDRRGIMSRYHGFKAIYAVMGGNFETGRDIVEELLAFCTVSPFAHHYMKARANRYLEQIRPQLSPQKFVEASERGKTWTFADVIAQLLPDINEESVKEPLE